MHIALTYSLLGRFAEASDAAQYAVTLQPSSLYRCFQALVWYDAGRFDEARKLLHTISAESDAPRLAYPVLLLVELNTGSYETARALLRTHGLPNCTHFGWRFYLIAIEQLHRRPPLCPADVLQDAEKVLAGIVAAEGSASKLQHRGIEAYNSFDYAQALHCFARAHKLKPRDAEIASELAECFGVLNMPERAWPYIDLAFRLHPDNLWVRFHLGKHLIRLGRYNAGEECLQTVLLQNSNLVDCYYELAVARLLAGDRTNARRHLQTFLHVDCDYSPEITRHYLKTIVGF